MAFTFNFSWGNQSQPISVERDRSGNWFYEMFNSSASHKELLTDAQKIKAVLNNPAVLKVFALNCDLFSTGVNKSGDIENFLQTQRSTPNFKQGWTQYFWDYMFWVQTGTAYMWNPNNAKVLGNNNTVQWLNPANIEWQPSLIDKLSGLIFSNATLKDITKNTVKYKLCDGSSKLIPLNEITPFFDLTNGVSGNFYKGESRLNALYKIISNSEQALDSKSKNLEYSRKFMVNGTNSVDDITSLPMSETEKLSIESVMNSPKSVHAVKSPIEIKRFVDDIANLKIDESFYNDYLMIGSLYNIPRELLDANLLAKGNTYENKEKAIGFHVEYTMIPKAKNLMDGFMSMFGYKDLSMTWEHASFNQVFEIDRQVVIKAKLDNIILAKTNGIDLNKL